jgi:hypothetical protein
VTEVEAVIAEMDVPAATIGITSATVTASSSLEAVPVPPSTSKLIGFSV